MSLFSAFGNIIGRPLSWFTGAFESPSHATTDGHDSDSDTDADSDAGTVGSDNDDVEPHEPSILDVLVIKAMLNKALALPPELLNTILDLAEYWPHTTTEWSGGPLSIFGGGRGREDVFLLRSKPLGFTKAPDDPNLPLDYETTPSAPQHLHRQHSLETFQDTINSSNPLLEHPCRKIVFTIRSHDQGWGGEQPHHGTYEGSWTWFDAGLEKFDAGEETEEEDNSDSPNFTLTKLRSIWPEVVAVSRDGAADTYAFHHELLADQGHKIQANVLARRPFTDHRVEWSWTDDIDPSGGDARLEQLVKAGRGTGTGNGEFVRNLTLGDVVTVWGRARFPAWVNTVERVRIDVYWAV
ncbi:hypothetical protein CONLIGDRAFT_630748 [Coniochaeta ligniaria NRRL 30616]|uniref:Uncharacterized protein n=1 Tax=Coniochaeta ligniaria NRRL 30616 TaxID=1408157 RepID=A0A1J7IT45_9PEZI|nr:hypothetical protein CONLIGDRAFT_630748 [Coniochaeta ligniaria NRRL 30616]